MIVYNVYDLKDLCVFFKYKLSVLLYIDWYICWKKKSLSKPIETFHKM